MTKNEANTRSHSLIRNGLTRRQEGISVVCGRRSPATGQEVIMDTDASTVLGRVSDLLREASETHHQVFRIVDGVDPDWASWYADWLLNQSELPSLLQAAPVRSELVYLLVSLDKEYTASGADGSWERYYAGRIIEHFTGQHVR